MNTTMWTATTRAQHMRDGLRFASDATDAEWAVLAPLLPRPSSVGRPPQWPMREIVNAIFYVLRGGIPWRMLPPCFPPRQTVYGWFAAWRDAGVWQSINHHLVMLDRERAGREASPSAAKPAVHADTTRARRCWGANAMRWWTPTVVRWC
jgi:transposase